MGNSKRLGGRVTEDIARKATNILRGLGFIYGNGADVSGFWEALASGKLIIVRAENIKKD